MTVFLTGEFVEKEAVTDAIRQLRAGGIEPGSLDLFSTEPVELARGVLDRPSRMSLVTVSAAVAFGVLSTVFIAYTQHDYKLVTGGMPLFSFWATGVITYEMTMLGAIVATFAWFLRESGLMRRRDKNVPVPRVGPGVICLRVRCQAEQVAMALEALRRHGAVEVERSGV
ncbi:MAG TPA: quinol:electron acceptor oxidoreductase subunit ActD [Bryobacteraceae bacterium]|jgi:hypothetical protein|nr:quinol:electron acceptor oxidoreductase subunit ActD [Bryobacteraceae bacterium]